MNTLWPIRTRSVSATPGIPAALPGLAHAAPLTPRSPTPASPLPMPMPASSPASASISLHIERLIVQGVSLRAEGSGRLEAAFQAELLHLASVTPLSAERLSSVALHALRLRPIHLAHADEPEQLGRKLAHTLWEGLMSSGRAAGRVDQIEAPT